MIILRKLEPFKTGDMCKHACYFFNADKSDTYNHRAYLQEDDESFTPQTHIF